MQTDALFKAADLLQKHKVCIISQSHSHMENGVRVQFSYLSCLSRSDPSHSRKRLRSYGFQTLLNNHHTKMALPGTVRNHETTLNDRNVIAA